MCALLKYAYFENSYLENLITLGKYWNEDDQLIKNFKNDLYKSLQNNEYCAYCRKRLHRKKYDEIDHILFKADYNHYTFQPKNLVLACKRCNNIKLNKNVLKQEYIELFKELDWTEYPDDEIYFKIVHPYFDLYSEHIDIKRNIFYVPNNNSSKGLNTIEMMNLNGFDHLEIKVKESFSSSDIIKKYLSNPDTDEQLIIWSKFSMENASFQKMLFDILIDFQNGNYKGFKLPQIEYFKLKNIIMNDSGKYPAKFEITFRATARFVKLINGIDDERIIMKAIDQLEELFKLSDLNKDFEYSLFLAIIFIIKLKEGKYSKNNITKYLAG